MSFITLFSGKFSFFQRKRVDYLSIYLDGGGSVENLAEGWNKFANFKLALINQINHKMTITKGVSHTSLSFYTLVLIFCSQSKQQFHINI